MMSNLGVGLGDIVKVKSATLPKGKYVKLRPQSKTFLDIANPKVTILTAHHSRAFDPSMA